MMDRIPLLVCLLLSFQQVLGSAVLLTPSGGGAAAVSSLVLFQGAQIQPDAYIPLAKSIQGEMQQNSQPICVAIPEAILDLQNPLTLKSSLESSLKELRNAGCNVDQLFVAGHSLGGAVLPLFVDGNVEKYNITGTLLFAAALPRKYRNDKEFPSPTLCISGDLDGLWRVTRMAEELWHRVDDAGSFVREDGKIFPVIIVPGMSHMQFASGEAPYLVRERDLQPEISYLEAYKNVAQASSAFMLTLLNADKTALTNLQDKVHSSLDLVKPIFDAYQKEGSRQFNSPHQVGGPQEDCPRGLCKGGGSEWAAFAQTQMSDVGKLNKEGWELHVTNDYVKLTETPPFGDFHLPFITHPSPHQIELATYSQCYWEKLDSLDTAFVETSAHEIATKLMSRQCSFIRGANYTKDQAPFSLDDGDLCADINRQAYEAALKMSTNTQALARFNQYGTKMTFGADQKKSGGPFFVNARLVFEEKDAADGSKVMEVSAPMLKTSADFPVIPGLPDPSCYHYCKLLSPARALEWIWVDSLRAKGGIKPNASQ